MAKEQVDTETLGAHLARENMSMSRANERLYNDRRKLENVVREHATHDCGCESPHVCLAKLLELVPKNPRPTLREARAAVAKTKKSAS